MICLSLAPFVLWLFSRPCANLVSNPPYQSFQVCTMLQSTNNPQPPIMIYDIVFYWDLQLRSLIFYVAWSCDHRYETQLWCEITNHRYCLMCDHLYAMSLEPMILLDLRYAMLADPPICDLRHLPNLWYALLSFLSKGTKPLNFNWPCLLIQMSIFGLPHTARNLILSTIQWIGSNLALSS